MVRRLNRGLDDHVEPTASGNNTSKQYHPFSPNRDWLAAALYPARTTIPMTTPLGLSHTLRRNALSKIRLTQTPFRPLFTRSAPPPTSRIRTGAYATVFALSTGLFAIYYFDARSALHRYFLTPVLRYAFTPENGHKIAVRVLRTGWGPKDPVGDDERLRVEVCGVLFFVFVFSVSWFLFGVCFFLWVRSSGARSCRILWGWRLGSTRTERRLMVRGAWICVLFALWVSDTR